MCVMASDIKLVLFDLDGVLIDAKKIHYDALNAAIVIVAGEEYSITAEEHRNFYDGRKTKEKLVLLTERKRLPPEFHDRIFSLKQHHTMNMMETLQPNEEHLALFDALIEKGYSIGVCTNSIRRTVLTALANVSLTKYCSIILSNEDVKNSKPHPEIYWKAMSMLGFLPEETMIVEDSPPGLLSAARSGAKYIRVENPMNLTKEKVMKNLSGITVQNKWKSEELNVLIPMAGAGSRFHQAGYTFPKPLIDVNGKSMIQRVVENIGLDANFIFVCQKEHRESYNLDNMLPLIAPNCKIVETDGITEGAACTALLAKEHIDNDNPLFFSNSDQWVDWDPVGFMYKMQETASDGGIVTFKATHPKWSFAKIDDNGVVVEVAEKNPISDNATVGYYYWKCGSDFVKYAEQMIENDIRVNGEFYVCPVFNEAIKDEKIIRTFEAQQMWGLGTPEDLEHFIVSNL